MDGHSNQDGCVDAAARCLKVEVYDLQPANDVEHMAAGTRAAVSTLEHMVMFCCLPDTHPEAPAVQHRQVPVQGRRKLILERLLFLVILL